MIDRLREIANRPVRELSTGLALAACAALIVLGALTLSQIRDPEPRPASPPPPGALEEGGYEVTNPPVVSHDQQLESEHENPDFPREYPSSPHDDANALAGARRFMRGYLAYQYGHGEASEITDLTRELLARLEQSPPRVPDRVRDRRARLVFVRLDDPSGTGDGTRVLALVDDGTTRHTIALRLIQTGMQQWTVAEVDSA